jgi:membrane associated rhomboid family serine protease
MVVGRVIFGAALALLPGFYTPGVDAFAHLGGFVFGLLFGVFMKAPGRKRQRRE